MTTRNVPQTRHKTYLPDKHHHPRHSGGQKKDRSIERTFVILHIPFGILI